jgi:exosortase/archaeosortase family protein
MMSKQPEVAPTSGEEQVQLSRRYLWKQRVYSFSSRSLVLFALGALPLCAFFFLFFSLDINMWLQEILTKQAHLVMSGILQIPSQVTFNPTASVPWAISVQGGKDPFGISLFCTAAQVFSIFAGVVISIPHSAHPSARRDILWRKAKSLTVMIALVYVVNLVRIVTLLYCTSVGMDSGLVHSILLYITGVVGAVIFIYILYRWLPEIYIAVYDICRNTARALQQERTI